ncbi:helix-turn-helix transcriptional regulator [uncultured Tolumonas sp.]|uniref:helix-turn-helix domain-containing protein n=1 Tax=uncultured Tolumonas sp. TaxID=263765 RepID=UPI0029318592|nr:helix-turn-helix transcriptional regulator [uncultured Tolumonas sp.]
MTDINMIELGQSVGRAIARQRIRSGMTQEYVAEHLNIGSEAVSRMERGLVVPTVIRLVQLAQLFHCELVDLLQETSCRPSDQAIVLANILSRLETSDRVLLMDTIERLADRFAKAN